MSAGQQARRAERTAKQAADSGPVKTLGRVGLVAYGLVHLLVAYLAFRVALGGGAKADKTGALQTIAEQPAGRALLWVLTVGLAALTLWQLAEAGWGHQHRHPQRRRTLQRLISLGEAAVAGALAFSSFKVASGKAGKSKEEKTAFVDKVFDWPAVTYDPAKATGMDTALKTLAGQPYGTVLLLIVAAGLACFGAYCLFDARYRRG